MCGQKQTRRFALLASAGALALSMVAAPLTFDTQAWTFKDNLSFASGGAGGGGGGSGGGGDGGGRGGGGDNGNGGGGCAGGDGGGGGGSGGGGTGGGGTGGGGTGGGGTGGGGSGDSGEGEGGSSSVASSRSIGVIAIVSDDEKAKCKPDALTGMTPAYCQVAETPDRAERVD